MRELKDNVMKLAETFGKDYLQVIFAEVKSVNEDERTCTVIQISGDADTEIPDVKLLAESNDGFLRIPTVGSTVIVSVTKNNEPFILMFSDCDKIYSIQDDFQFNDGSFGGLTKTQELKTQLDKNNQILQAILTVITGAPIPEPGNGASSALQIALNTALTGKQIGDFSNIENPKITHG